MLGGLPHPLPAVLCAAVPRCSEELNRPENKGLAPFVDRLRKVGMPASAGRKDCSGPPCMEQQAAVSGTQRRRVTCSCAHADCLPSPGTRARWRRSSRQPWHASCWTWRRPARLLAGWPPLCPPSTLQVKDVIDARAEDGQGPISWADTIVLAAKVSATVGRSHSSYPCANAHLGTIQCGIA